MTAENVLKLFYYVCGVAVVETTAVPKNLQRSKNHRRRRLFKSIVVVSLFGYTDRNPDFSI